MSRISLSITFAGYLVAKLITVCEASRDQDGPEPYATSEYFIHPRAQLRDAFHAVGSPQPLLDDVAGLHAPRKLGLPHGHLGRSLVIDARPGKVRRPSRSQRTRRGLTALFEAEPEAFVPLWHGVAEVA